MSLKLSQWGCVAGEVRFVRNRIVPINIQRFSRYTNRHRRAQGMAFSVTLHIPLPKVLSHFFKKHR